MASNLGSSLTDKQKALRLPPELKQEHGDAIVMVADDDVDLQNDLMSMILNVGDLDDGCPPYVVPWEESCVWVQNILDNLDISLEYFTLLFCIITDNLLYSRHFADGALLTILEQKKETFIPVFKNKSEYERMKSSQDANNKLPGVYRIVKPVFLEGNGSLITGGSGCQNRRVTQLKKLFNHHLHTKLQRRDKQERDIIQALADMEEPLFVPEGDLIEFDPKNSSRSAYNFQFSTVAQPPSVDRSQPSSGYDSLSGSESSNFKGGSCESVLSNLSDHDYKPVDFPGGKFPPTEIELKEQPTATTQLLTQADMSIDAVTLSTLRTMVQPSGSEPNIAYSRTMVQPSCSEPNIAYSRQQEETLEWELQINCENQEQDNLSSNMAHQSYVPVSAMSVNENSEESSTSSTQRANEQTPGDMTDHSQPNKNITSQINKDCEPTDDSNNPEFEAESPRILGSVSQWQTAAAGGVAGLAIGVAVAFTIMKLK